MLARTISGPVGFGVKLRGEPGGQQMVICGIDWTWLAVGTTSTGTLFPKSSEGEARAGVSLPVFPNNIGQLEGLVESIRPVVWWTCRWQLACKEPR